MALLERTPYAMVLARLKVLIERLRGLTEHGHALLASVSRRGKHNHQHQPPFVRPVNRSGAGRGLLEPSTGGVGESINHLTSREKILEELDVSFR